MMIRDLPGSRLSVALYLGIPVNLLDQASISGSVKDKNEDRED